MIRIVNLKCYVPVENEILIRIDKTALKTPFEPENSSKYKDYFYRQINKMNEDFINELKKIYNLSYKTNIAFGCICDPKNCYENVIKEYIDKIRRFCYWHGEDEESLYCTAHIAEGRCFTCPFRTPKIREENEYPCSDYIPTGILLPQWVNEEEK